MKYTLAVLALLSVVSAVQLREEKFAPYVDEQGYVVMKQDLRRSHDKKKKYVVTKPSDETCDGDASDDKQLEHEADHDDDIVEDHGFSGSRGATIRLQTHSEIGQMSNAELNAMLNKRHQQLAQYSFNKESDGTCDGDAADDKEIQDSADPHDDIVEDFGFSGSRNARGQVRLMQTGRKSKYTFDKYSDGLANGDSADDKPIEHEEDPKNPVVDYNGHTNAGYGHTRYDDPEHHYKFDQAHYANNNVKNLFPEHFGTVPRATSPYWGI